MVDSSQISDGAAATILARRSWADDRGLKPLGRFIGTQVAGCAPDEMGISPVFAIPALFKYAGIELKDVDFFELNEAFASQSLYCIHKLGLDMERVNPNGGAIAIGHPTGATGARQTATLFNELQSNDKEVGVISMCARYVCLAADFQRSLLTVMKHWTWRGVIVYSRIEQVNFSINSHSIVNCAFYFPCSIAISLLASGKHNFTESKHYPQGQCATCATQAFGTLTAPFRLDIRGSTPHPLLKGCPRKA